MISAALRSGARSSAGSRSRSGRRWSFHALLLILTLAAAPAVAETRLERAMPAADSSVTAPSELRLGFTDAIDPRLATVSIVSSAGAEIAIAGLATDARDSKMLVATFTRPLAPGKYLVEWRLGGSDAAAIQGRYSFTVAGIVAPG